MQKVLKFNILIVFYFFFSCEKVFMPENGKNNAFEIFNELWSGINDKYSLFAYSKVNWDSIKFIYQSKINRAMSDKALYNTLSDMIFELEDGHTNIVAEKYASYYNYADSSIYPINYYRDVIITNYYTINHPVYVHQNYAYCWLGNRNIGYMIFSYNFDEKTTEKDFVKMLEYFKDSKGLIIDLRQNGGGNNSIAIMMLSHFTNKKLLVSKSKYKNGKSHNDFSPWVEDYIKPGSPYFDKKVVLLTNRVVYSTANEMVLWSKAFPNIIRIGTKTGGGIGIPSFHYLSNGWYYRTSCSIVALPDETILYNGVEPDIEVITKRGSRKDALIEKALQILN